jgi:hypothetical protein
MSGDPNRKSTTSDADVVRSPGSGLSAPEEEHEAYTTTQTAGGLAAGEPSGGPQQTPERAALDKARKAEADTKLPPDPRDVTPPHGDPKKH